jgi:hypothetical protein
MTDTTMTDLIGTMRATLDAIDFDASLLGTIATNCARHLEDLQAQLAALQALRPDDDYPALHELLATLAQLDDIADELVSDYAAQELTGLEVELEDEADA